MEYQYPLDLDWTNEEMVDVIAFFNKIERRLALINLALFYVNYQNL